MILFEWIIIIIKVFVFLSVTSGQDRQDIRRQPAVLQAAGAEAGSGVAYRLEKVPVFLEGR